MSSALGLIETIGLPAAIAAADVAVKSANVKLIGYELTRGGGMVTVKIVGDVGAVKSAVKAAASSAQSVGQVWATHVIARPHKETEGMVYPIPTKPKKKLFVVPKETKKDSAEIKGKQITDSQVENQELSQKEAKIEIAAEINEKEITDNEVEQPSQILSEQEKKVENDEKVCNLCGDPKCPRQKGEPKVNCINFQK